MPNSRPRITERMISDYCRKKLAPLLPPADVDALRQYLCDANLTSKALPHALRSYDWYVLAVATGLPEETVTGIRGQLVPLLDAIARSIRIADRTGAAISPTLSASPPASGSVHVLSPAGRAAAPSSDNSPPPRPKRKYTTAPVVEFPEPQFTEWVDPAGLGEALSLHAKRHGETIGRLYRAVAKPDRAANLRTMVRWANGTLLPRSLQSLEVLGRIERRYRLPAGYFKAKLPHPSRAALGHALDEFSPAERRRLAWHLPDDFNTRSAAQQEEILAWVNRVIISGSTDYRAYQAAAMKNRYAVRFPTLEGTARRTSLAACDVDADNERSAVVDAPPQLDAEMAALIRFKTSTLTEFGFQRTGVWGSETASQKVEHFGLMFGALAAGTKSAVRGRGVAIDMLCLGMLVFPAVWDWYLQWREHRRGFYTAWEIDMLAVTTALVKTETGWIRQTPSLAERLTPVSGLITEADIAVARSDWNGVCDAMHRHARQRIKEIQRVARVHRDPFEPILPILEAESPLSEYRKITEEIVRLMPDERRYPRAAAEAVRSFLMLRIGLHTGLRQRNLRELRICLPHQVPASERQLADLRCGELRWSVREHGWEILIPSVAFKNASSSFFGQKPFRLVLPDLGGLYEMIEAYINRHRTRLLGPAADPGTFFVKTAKLSSTSAAYNQNTFYEAWKLTIQRYGIFNPYTGRGVIEGLLPHGPHNVRDVLATHILKKTGSYEQASYAIQDTPEMVAQHYGRFLPQDKAAIAAAVLNRVWDAA